MQMIIHSSSRMRINLYELPISNNINSIRDDQAPIEKENILINIMKYTIYLVARNDVVTSAEKVLLKHLKRCL